MEQGSEALARGDFREAAQYFRAAHSLAPEATGPLLALGLALQASNQCEEAVLRLEEYVKKKPDGNPKARAALEDCRSRSKAPPLATSSAPLAKSEAAGSAPLTANASGSESASPRPWYQRWYVWTGVGAVVVAGVVTGVVLASGGGSNLPKTPGGNMVFVLGK